MPESAIYQREFDFDDGNEIDEIYARNPRIGTPSLNNLISNAVFVKKKDDRIAGYGALKVFAEGILILDKDLRLREKAEIVKLSTPYMIERGKEANLEYLYVIVNDEGYSKILRERYGFLRVPGELLMSYLK